MVATHIFFYVHPEPWGRCSPILTFAAYSSDGLVKNHHQWKVRRFLFQPQVGLAKIPPHHYDESFCTCLPKWLSEQAILRSYFATWCVRWLLFGQDRTKNPYPPPKKTIELSAPFFVKCDPFNKKTAIFL